MQDDEPIRPGEWPAYWLLRYQLEREFAALCDTQPGVYGLVDWLAEHCFGCGIRIDGDAELCPACSIAGRWRLN